MATNPNIYVSSVHGTNTGTSDTSFASVQTGAMTSITASSVYDNLESAVAGASMSSGDIVYVADDHSTSYVPAAQVALSTSSARDAVGLLIVSVDAANVDQYKPGASETLNSNDSYLLTGVGKIAGISLKNNDNTLHAGNTCIWTLQDSTITAQTGTGDAPISMDTDGSILDLLNVDLVFGATVNEIPVGNAGRLTMIGGSIGGSAAGQVFSTRYNGGANIELVGTDLSSQSGTIMVLTTATDSDIVNVTLRNCKLHASVTLHDTLLHKGTRFELYNTDDATSDEYHRFYVADGVGSVRNNDSTYVTATEAWYGGSVKSSMEVTTTAICSKVQPFIFEIPAQYVDLSQAASNVLTLELTTDTALTLTDTDIAAFLVYPDGTTSVQPNWVTSGKTVGAGNYGIDPLAAGTTLTTGSLGAGDWTGEDAISPNFYKMVLDTSGDAGQATAVSIRIEVYKASIAAGTLFIHPLLTLS